MAGPSRPNGLRPEAGYCRRVTLWEERAARNESLFREVNDQVVALAWHATDETVGFVCECSDADCAERLHVPLGVYQDVRSNPRRFIVVPGHERVELETVVDRNDGYTVVEKEGVAGRIADRLD